MAAPSLPTYTGDIDIDLDKIKEYLEYLISYLNDYELATGYALTGLSVDRTLASGDTLADTQNFLGTLVQDLIDRKVPSL